MPFGDARAMAWGKVSRLPNYHRDRLRVERENKMALHKVLGQC